MQNLVGLVMPFVIDIVNTKISDTRLRFVVSFLICALVAVALNFEKLTFGDYNQVFASIGLIFTESQLVYKLYWEKAQKREVFLDGVDQVQSKVASISKFFSK